MAVLQSPWKGSFSFSKCGTDLFPRFDTFKAYVCQMCGKYAKTKFEIIKHKKKKLHVFVYDSKW